MTETYKIVTGIYDVEITPKLYPAHSLVTRGIMILDYLRVTRNMIYENFTLLTGFRNRLPNNVVLSESLNVFKSRLDKFLQNQDVVYDYRADIQETGNRS